MPAATPRLSIGLAILLSLASADGVRAQSGTSSTEAVTLGTGGFVLNFAAVWTCDDAPASTTSAAGEIDLLAPGGTVVGAVSAVTSGTVPTCSVTGPGSVSGLTASIHLQAANGTPADGSLHGTWTITGPPPGSYSLRFWHFVRSTSGKNASDVTTVTSDSGGSHEVSVPTPTPTPAPPSATVSAPASVAVFSPAAIHASATAGGRPLLSVSLSASSNNGATWTPILSNASPSSPSDTEVVSYAFGATGSALVRVVAVDTSGLGATATQAVSVGKAGQGVVKVSPASAVVSAGGSLTFSASGGSTGNYSWAGAASGSGPTASVVFPAAGSFSLTVADSGNADYSPSNSAAASVTVQPVFFTLSISASPGGSVSGGGSYLPNSDAAAAASSSAGYAFTGWTGDMTSPNPSVSVLMNANKSLAAHFAAMLQQSIAFVLPKGVTTRTPAFSLSASATSGLPVSFALSSGPVALSGSLVTPTGAAGQASVTATQPGNAQYLPAPPVVISFPVGIPLAAVLFSDDSAATKRSDRTTRTTSYTSNPGH